MQVTGMLTAVAVLVLSWVLLYSLELTVKVTYFCSACIFPFLCHLGDQCMKFHAVGQIKGAYNDSQVGSKNVCYFQDKNLAFKKKKARIENFVL